jgi:Tfp pilus assembly protein PilV
MRRISPRSPSSGPSGLTLVEVLMSMMVAGIGILSVIVLLPLSFVRAVQATNMTNGTILRFNAECLLDANPSLLLRWQANQAYSATTVNASTVNGGAAGDVILVPANSNLLFQCTTAGTSGLSTPPWNTTVGGTTPDGTVVWTTFANPLPAFVIDPLGWNALAPVGAPPPPAQLLQTNFGNNGASTPAVDPKAIPRFNGELSTIGLASLVATLPDSWVEQARGAVTAFTSNSATISGPDLSGVGFSTPNTPVAAPTPLPVISRVVLLGYNNPGAANPTANTKSSETRIITGTTPASGMVNWGVSLPGPPAVTTEPLTAGFTPLTARVETRDPRYTWMLTVHPNPPAATSGPSWNVTVTVFFNRSLVSLDEQVYQASGADGVQSPFLVTYPSGAPPQYVKRGGFVFDCYFARWYRIVNVVNDPVQANTLDVYVDQQRPQSDVLTNLNFGVVFMRGVIDQYPLVLK